MPDPETDISSASADFRHELNGPDGEDVERSFAPDAIEASRARELGLGVGARELDLQHDAHGSGPAPVEGDVEKMTPEEIAAADAQDEAAEDRAEEDVRKTAESYSGLGK